MSGHEYFVNIVCKYHFLAASTFLAAGSDRPRSYAISYLPISVSILSSRGCEDPLRITAREGAQPRVARTLTVIRRVST